MFNEFLERLFSRSKDKNSRNEVKRRLKLVLAHDRADLPPAVVESMQQEILEVISRYVELDTEGLSFALESDRRTTALTANFPILRVKDGVEESQSEEDNPDLENSELENSESPPSDSESPSEAPAETLEIVVEEDPIEEDPSGEIPETTGSPGIQ
ncbi:MAG TPA: cell division topological specificity factor MinE [Oscillatoriales cyanobacterium M59_W2019_021]|nr:MAG: cell division topological specificity factor MinE [Cyanobacteria bacterium J055]HIK33918.1 cell division topological specificity factor MinE [Oscillatoriales cyanobacterium M4454_W2019_049]HIK51433.1 cell division topological specificity factor MinE [Oscillatoriales cyanobacterium M59_W2019_021]